MMQYGHKLKKNTGSKEYSLCAAPALMNEQAALWHFFFMIPFFPMEKNTEMFSAHILVKILIFCILPWLRTPSSSSTCHMPTACVRKWTQGLCCIIQSTSSVPTQHCLKDRYTDRNEKEACQERDCTQCLPTTVIP